MALIRSKDKNDHWIVAAEQVAFLIQNGTTIDDVVKGSVPPEIQGSISKKYPSTWIFKDWYSKHLMSN